MSKLIRVLIADDSSIMRRTIAQALSQQSGVELVGAAQDGAEAISYFRTQQPDVILLDVDMPRLNGLTALKSIRESSSTVPIIMFGSFPAANDAARREAMEAGASDCVSKPTGVGHIDTVIAYLKKEVVSKICSWGQRAVAQSEGAPKTERTSPTVPQPAVVQSKVVQPKPEKPTVASPVLPTASSNSAPLQSSGRTSQIHAIAIGSSTGGPNALAEIIARLPKDIGVPILIAQHMPPLFTQLLAERLDRCSSLTVREGFDGAVIKANEVWLAPGDFHMSVMRQGASVVLRTTQTPPENSCRPAVDVLFRSMAEIYGRNTLAIVLTGMGRDGTAGCQVLSQFGARIIAQDEASSVVWGMPRSVVEAGFADSVLSLKDIAPAVTMRIRGAQLSSKQAESVVASTVG